MTRTATKTTIFLTALICAAVVWMAGAGSAVAPEPARLTSTLSTTGAANGVYIYSLGRTTAYFLSASWTPSSLPVGAPCSTVAPLPYNPLKPLTLTTVVQGSGNYRRCA